MTTSAADYAPYLTLFDDLLDIGSCRIREGDRLTLQVEGKSGVYKVNTVTSPIRGTFTINVSPVEQL